MIWLSRWLFLEQMNDNKYFPSIDINFEKWTPEGYVFLPFPFM